METLYEVTLDRLVYGGDAMGRLPDGRAVFAPFGLPGERVRLRLSEEKRGHARGEIVEWLTTAPQRIAPRCPHFAECGGCHYQHLPYEAQLEAKGEIVRDQLARLGGLEDPPLDPVQPSPPGLELPQPYPVPRLARGPAGLPGSALAPRGAHPGMPPAIGSDQPGVAPAGAGAGIWRAAPEPALWGGR